MIRYTPARRAGEGRQGRSRWTGVGERGKTVYLVLPNREEAEEAAVQLEVLTIQGRGGGASEPAAARGEAAKGDGWATGERRLGEGEVTSFCRRVSGREFIVQANKLSIDQLTQTSRDLSPTSQLVERQAKLVVSLQLVDIEFATRRLVARQTATCRATRNPWTSIKSNRHALADL